jgi:D-cysteine desulfhydrase
MKLRTVEFLLADALARGFKRIIAIGPIGSSLLALLAFFGKKHDLEVSALHTPQKPSLDVERILRFSANYLSNLKLVMNNPQAYLEFFLESGIGDPPSYPVYPQGMGFLGSLASICAGYELALKLRDPHLPAFEAVFLPSYSGTFALGVSAGLKLGGLDLPIHAVVVGETRLTWFSRKILKRTLSTLRILDPSFPQLPISQLKIFWERRFMGGGFGIPTMEAKSIKAVMDLSEEVPLELTYTAKCLSAVMDYHRTHPHHGPILFWNTAPPIPPDSMLKSFEGLPEAYREYFRKSARIPQDS